MKRFIVAAGFVTVIVGAAVAAAASSDGKDSAPVTTAVAPGPTIDEQTAKVLSVEPSVAGEYFDGNGHYHVVVYPGEGEVLQVQASIAGSRTGITVEVLPATRAALDAVSKDVLGVYNASGLKASLTVALDPRSGTIQATTSDVHLAELIRAKVPAATVTIDPSQQNTWPIGTVEK